jgi:Phage integrase, N-terminal SAM-like domain
VPLSVRKFHFLEVSPSLPFPRKLLVDLTCLSLVNDKGRYHTQKQRKGSSPHTCETYAHAFRLLFIFASKRLGIRPSQICLEQIDAALILEFLAHIEEERGNCAATRNGRLAAVKAFIRTLKGSSDLTLYTLQRELVPGNCSVRPSDHCCADIGAAAAPGFAAASASGKLATALDGLLESYIAAHTCRDPEGLLLVLWIRIYENGARHRAYRCIWPGPFPRMPSWRRAWCGRRYQHSARGRLDQ